MNALVFLLACALGALSDDGTAPKGNKYVSMAVSLSSSLIRPGDSGTIRIAFNPADGFHVNADPPLGLKISTKNVITLLGKPDIVVDEESGFHSTKTPVDQRFAVARNAAPGRHTIKGILTYYFCSDSEGWCTKAHIQSCSM
ncbi:MAG: hypothetical protein AAB393_08555 [Bacteroidota bacterium]